MLRLRPLAVLSLTVVGVGSAQAAPPTTHVLADRVEAAERTLTIVIERAGDCVASAALQVAPPFVGTVETACVLTVRGPAAAAPIVALAGAPIDLPPAPAARDEAPPRPAGGPATPGPRWTVIAAPSIAVGAVATAARVWVLVDGKPTTTVDLNVRVEGARVRALRWQQPGLAAIDVLVPTWTPTIELVIQHRGGAETRTPIAVDPGLPIDATVASAAARAGEPFPIEVTITSRAGVPVERARIRFAAAGCVAAADQLTCARAGPAVVVVHVEHAGGWVPIAHATVEVMAPPPSPPPSPPPRPRRGRLGWEVAARGARATDGLWSAGVIASAVRRLGPRVDATLGLGWQFGQMRLAPMAPVVDALTLSEHQVEVRAGVTAQIVEGAPWSIRIAAGPIAVRQRGAMSEGGWICYGLRAQAVAAVGVQRGLGPRTLRLEVGGRAAVDVLAPDWARPDRQVFVEVALGGRR